MYHQLLNVDRGNVYFRVIKDDKGFQGLIFQRDVKGVWNRSASRKYKNVGHAKNWLTANLQKHEIQTDWKLHPIKNV